MFLKQDGFLGVLFLEDQNGSAVTLSFWRDLAAVKTLEASASYRATVDAIANTGFLIGTQSVKTFEVKGGRIDSVDIDRTLGFI